MVLGGAVIGPSPQPSKCDAPAAARRRRACFNLLLKFERETEQIHCVEYSNMVRVQHNNLDSDRQADRQRECKYAPHYTYYKYSASKTHIDLKTA
jgi:hypothetical protein